MPPKRNERRGGTKSESSTRRRWADRGPARPLEVGGGVQIVWPAEGERDTERNIGWGAKTQRRVRQVEPGEETLGGVRGSKGRA